MAHRRAIQLRQNIVETHPPELAAIAFCPRATGACQAVSQQRPREGASGRFRVLVGSDTGCPNVTQFVGFVQPCRASDHSHPYDEVGYILAGHGYAHVDGAAIPIAPGSCFHLPPGTVHCIENVGPETMRILGRYASNPDLSFSWYDAAVLSQRIRQEERQQHRTRLRMPQVTDSEELF